MKVTIEADAKEIAALVLELQERRVLPDKVQVTFDGKKVMASVLEDIRGRLEANSRRSEESASEGTCKRDCENIAPVGNGSECAGFVLDSKKHDSR